ncbi:hypothetical protein QT196_39160 (plasmid) [Streptomyces sp. P9-2B-2]|nr:hypothetical protein [Streptomyces sp. P9-2B-2]WJY43280.1 hypothetical protein QT196_39160 [Streptomyces sp. P9-2B-2]
MEAIGGVYDFLPDSAAADGDPPNSAAGAALSDQTTPGIRD